MDAIKQALASGLPVPEKLILAQATVSADGLLYAGIGWGFSGDLQAGVWGKVRPANRAIADGAAAVINGIREQVGAADDSPGVLTMPELAQVLMGLALGKH